LTTFALFIAALIWAGVSPKTYVIKASGLVTSEGKVNIMNRVPGAIERIYAAEGQTIAEGDPIIEIDAFQTELQIAQLESARGFIEGKIALIGRLITFINAYTVADPQTQVNPFDASVADEAKYYADTQSFIDYARTKNDPNGTPGDGDDTDKTQDEVNGVKSSFISQQGYYTALDQYQSQLSENAGQLAMYRDSLAEYTVRADCAGVVHLTAGITVGTVIQAGTLLGSVNSADEGAYYFEAVISAGERGKVKVGDGAEIALAGVVQAEFGVLTGKVTAIDADSTQTENGEVFYRVKIKPDATRLADKRGGVITLTSGMIAESRIQYDETTWLKWAIEQIGVKFR
jgi:multidrug efflux pump subunit AcrA (membrane-fusion protein)